MRKWCRPKRLTSHPLRKQIDRKTEAGIYTPTQIAKILLECFDKSALALFCNYLSHHSQVRKWIIAADFALHDKARPLDCFAFTILPYDEWPAEIKKDVAQALPKDLKKSKALDEAGVEWLRDRRRFHVMITVNKDRMPFSNGPGTNPREVAREQIDKTLALAAVQGTKGDTIRRFKKLKSEAQAKAFNVDLLGDIWLLAIWFAVLTIIIGRERHCETIGWFPDRDKMTNWCNGIWQDYAYWNVQAFADSLTVDMRSTQIAVGAPDRSGANEIMWYDYMIRAADWFAGSVAAWDRKNNLVPSEHLKYRQMLEEVVADADNVIVLHLDITESGAQFRRIDVEKTIK